MKKILAVFTIVNIIICVLLFADIEKIDNSRISGVWVNDDFYYSFDKNGVMKAIKTGSDPQMYSTYQYEMIAMRNYELIRYGKNLTESDYINFLLVNDLEDSTAQIAYGMPFVRADSSKGLQGTWEHLENLTRLTWHIDLRTIEYSQSILDTKTGTFQTVEEHRGVYTTSRKRKELGIYFITFEDGLRARIMPIIFQDVLYIFDLNPKRSQFTITEIAPTYKDFKKALRNN